MGAERHMDMGRPSEAEIAQAANVLKRLPPGFLPYSLFTEVTRLTTTSIYELVPLRINNGKVEVLMEQRPPDDEFWANEWHTPGTVVRATDEPESDFRDARNRIIHGELHGISTIGEPIFFGIQHRLTPRSKEMVAWHYVLVDDDDPEVGQYFDVTDLPENTVGTQPKHIRMAAELVRSSIQDPR